MKDYQENNAEFRATFCLAYFDYDAGHKTYQKTVWKIHFA